MRRLAIWILVVAVTGVGASAVASAPSSGLHGVVRESGGGACSDGPSCAGLASGVTLVFSRHGKAIARTTTRRDGSYRLRLAPGRYSVRARLEGRSRISPAAVRVRAGRFAKVNFFLDSGVRIP